MPQAIPADTTIVRFPTTRKAAYRNPSLRGVTLPANVTLLREGRGYPLQASDLCSRRGPGVQAPSSGVDKTAALALVMGLMQALATGTKDQRRLFNQAAWQVAVMNGANPDDAALNGACDVLGKIRERV